MTYFLLYYIIQLNKNKGVLYVMLNQIKNSYESFLTQNFSEWKSINKNDLFKMYTSCSDENKKQCLFIAIILNYWTKISSLYQKSKSSATIEDCYDWIVDAARRALKYHPWDDEKNKIYLDPNGPDKVMNRCIKSVRLGHYERMNSAKRRLNVNLISLDSVLELDEDMPPITSEVAADPDLLTGDVAFLIIERFNKKDYFNSFLIYYLSMQEDLYNRYIKDSKSVMELNYKRLNYYMRHITKNCCAVFSNMFDLPLNEVEFAANTCNQLSSNKVNKAIRRYISLMASKI